MYIFRKQIASHPDIYVVIVQTTKENGNRGIWYCNQAARGLVKKP